MQRAGPGRLRNREEVSVAGPNERRLSSWWWGDNRGGGCLEDPHLAEAAQEVLGQWKYGCFVGGSGFW